MKNGDVVFFKRAKEGSARKAPEVQFKGYGFGVMLGHVPPFAKDPPPEHLLRLMGTVGFVSFDDVGEMLGPESGHQLIKKFEDKYYGKVVPESDPNQAELPLDAADPGPEDASGAPLLTPEPPEDTL